MRRLVALAATGAVLATGCIGPSGAADGDPSQAPSLPPLRIGTGSEAESRLLAHVMVELLRAAELPAEVVEFAESGDARQALELGAVDVRPAYTGEAWLEVMGRADPPGDPRTSFIRVRNHDRDNGIDWLRPTFTRDAGTLERPPANATFAFFVQGPPGIDADLRTMSQLATRLAEQPQAQVCVDREFGSRPDGLVAVWDSYRVALDREGFAASPADAVRLVSVGFCIAGLATATDGQAWLHGLHPLVDDLQVFPAFVVTAQYRDEAREEQPGLVPALGPLANNLTTAMLGRWNAAVAAGEAVETVAAVAARELLTLADRSVPAAPVPVAPGP